MQLNVISVHPARAPISDGTNEWVQLAEGEACVPYSHKHMQPPTWSEIREDGEALTRHLACCKDLSTTLEPTKKPTLMVRCAGH